MGVITTTLPRLYPRWPVLVAAMVGVGAGGGGCSEQWRSKFLVHFATRRSSIYVTPSPAPESPIKMLNFLHRTSQTGRALS